MADGVQRGYLVLADVSGYTAFLTGSELTHASEIMHDLTSCVIDNLRAPLRVVKLEGDAVFVYAPADAVSDGARVLEAVERCYIAFADRMFDIERQTTCPCAACSNVRTLDLKFVVHFGEFVEQRVTSQVDLAGPDVIVVHRLLKNGIVDALATPAYAFLTDPVLAQMAHVPELPEHEESIEHVGAVHGVVEDLRAMADAERARRSVKVAPDEAEVETTLALPVPRTIAWDWWTNPDLGRRYQPDLTSSEMHANNDGRVATGAVMHCAHGKAAWAHRILDWKPFDYYTQQLEPTTRSMKTPPPCIVTYEFTDDDAGGTVLTIRSKLTNPGVAMRLMKPLMRRMFASRYQDAAARFRALVDAGEVATGA